MLKNVFLLLLAVALVHGVSSVDEDFDLVHDDFSQALQFAEREQPAPSLEDAEIMADESADEDLDENDLVDVEISSTESGFLAAMNGGAINVSDEDDEDEEADAEEDDDEEDNSDASQLDDALVTADALEKNDVSEAEEFEDYENDNEDEEEDLEMDEFNPATTDPASVMGPGGPKDSTPVPDVEGLPSGMEDTSSAHPAESDDSSDNSEDDVDEEPATEEVDSVFKGAKQAKSTDAEPEESETVEQQEKNAPWGVQEQLKELRAQNAKLKEMLNRAVVTEEKLSEIVRADQGQPVQGFNKVFGAMHNQAKAVFDQKKESGEKAAHAQTQIQQGGVTASFDDTDAEDDDDEDSVTTDDAQTEASSDSDYDKILSDISA